MTDWSKYENKVNAEELNKEVEELGDGDFPEIPDGKYEVSLRSLELKPTKEKGYPMLAAQFKIVEGKYKGQNIFVNQVVIMGDNNDKYRVNASNRFLKSLGTKKTVSFESIKAYENLIDSIADEMDKAEYLIEQSTNSKNDKFKDYKILEIFEF